MKPSENALESLASFLLMILGLNEHQYFLLSIILRYCPLATALQANDGSDVGQQIIGLQVVTVIYGLL